MNPKNLKHTPIQSTKYDREYYEEACDGYKEFMISQGNYLPRRLLLPLEVSKIKTGMRILDVGSGRGEVILHSLKKGAWAYGVDYSWDALQVAKANLSVSAKFESNSGVHLYQSDAKFLPFMDASFDRIFFLDVVEHLYPEELAMALAEANRVLRPNGWLIVHTMPNLWYYRFGYPLFRLVSRIHGKQLPTDPRDRWKYKEVHVNEQTPLKLKKELVLQGFKTKIWLETTQAYDTEPNRIIRKIMTMLTYLYPFRWVFCNDIFAIGIKQ